MPLAPIGCVVLLHNKPETRRTWDDHVIEGYYNKTSREHWCYKIWFKNTRSIEVADTIFFKHQYITVPTITKADAIVAATTQLVKVPQKEVLMEIGEQEKEQLT